MRFLNPRGAISRNAQFHITRLQQGFHAAACFATERDNLHPAFMRRVDGAIHVGGIAAGGNRQQHVTLAPQGFNLPRKHPFVAVIVGDGGEGGSIGGQCNCGQAPAFLLETVEHFRGKMLRIARRTAIAATEDFAAVLHRVEYQCRGGENGVLQYREGFLFGCNAGGEVLLNACVQIHALARVESVFDPKDGVITFDRYHVKTCLGIRCAVLQIMLCGADDTRLLAGVNTVQRAAVTVAFAVTHFDKYDNVAVAHDQVDFAHFQAVILVQQV